ncbi:class I SAM-dependent methyltransferase [Thermodesulfobacteriota bacterium]
MKEKTLPGTVHLGYQYKTKNRFREKALCDLILYAVSLANASKSRPSNMDMDFVSLDIGCGSGHLLKACKEKGLKIEGADLDPACVELSGSYGKTHLIGNDSLLNYFETQSYDCMTFSHSLEHFDSPLDAVMNAKQISRWYLVFAVPNPCCLETVLISNPLRHNYSNLGHLCCWDRSHFNFFLTQRCGLDILKWEHYKIGLSSLPAALLNALRRKRQERQAPNGRDIQSLKRENSKHTLRRLVKKTFEPLETFLARLFPYLADELLVLTRIPEKSKDSLNRYWCASGGVLCYRGC